jgi:hypothetical protein
MLAIMCLCACVACVHAHALLLIQKSSLLHEMMQIQHARPIFIYPRRTLLALKQTETIYMYPNAACHVQGLEYLVNRTNPSLV